MGISGLLPVLGNIMESKHVSAYKGMKVAVDTVGFIGSNIYVAILTLVTQYGWLHRGAYSCSLELCTGAPTDKCVLKYFLSFYRVHNALVCIHNALVCIHGFLMNVSTGTSPIAWSE